MLSSFDQKVAVVDFYAKWCGPCQLMVPVLEKFAAAHADKVAVAKVDTDKYPSLGSKYEVEGLPTIVFFKDGVEVHREMGVLNEKQLLEKIEPHL